MNITIVAPYCSLPSEPYFNRFWYLAERLSQSHDVLLITSRFRHYDKSFRRHEDAAATSNGRLRVKLLDEPGYRKNVSLARVASHRVFVRNLARWLHSPQAAEQDIVYSAYPLMATNLLLGKHKARLGYKLIVDVQDVWPESFSSVVPFLKKVPHKLLPFASRANRAYRCADALVAVSQTYLDRAKEANPNVPGEAVYIGTDFAAIAPPPPRFRSKTTRLFYLGTLSYSYDVETVCKGVRKLLDDGENVELHIMGGGPDLEKLKQYENRAIKFYGYLPYYDRQCRLKCAIPRKRLEVRSGEISKGVTCKNSLYQTLLEKMAVLQGARGCITAQFFYNEETGEFYGVEINPRFGGGFPLTYAAGGNYPSRLMREYLGDEEIPFSDDWENNLIMLRYDAKVLVHEND
ncbi:ATP-grasp domain-containing protein [Neisseria meningitidis]|uniref:ATP-grasp domain-containing protein n=1 Tax=Neisseria meningitidis TaxID=487 RepID=UPI000BB6592D|nr:glycosyltransferase [Neisseria meningitidis]